MRKLILKRSCNEVEFGPKTKRPELPTVISYIILNGSEG